MLLKANAFMFTLSSLESISFSLSALGVLFLFACTFFLEAREVSFYELDDSFVGERVKLKGRVLWSRNVKGTALFELSDEMGLKKLKGVIFSPSEDQWTVLRQAGWVSAEGRVQEYRNEVELLVENIALIGLDAG
jgi:aspartyl/asparaginyl-tRNA synthetase